jgi:signal transduction histidine kinase
MTLPRELAALVASSWPSSDWAAMFDRDARCVFVQRGALGRIADHQLLGAHGGGTEDRDGAREAVRALLGAALETGESQDGEVAFVDPRFGPRTLQITARPLLTDGRCVGAVLRASESTQRRMQGRAVRLQQRLLASMSDGVLVLDAAEVVSYANPAVESLLGVLPGSLQDESVAQLGEPLATQLRRATRDPGAVGVILLEPVAPAAERRVLRCQVSTLSLDHEPHHLLVLTDVTQSHRLGDEVLEAERRERERIARDLHDGLGQDLTGVALMLSAIGAQARAGQPVGESSLAAAVDVVNDMILTTRMLTGGIFAQPLAAAGLIPALRELAARSLRRSGVDVRFAPPSQALPHLDGGVAEHLFRIAQEAVTNALRHSGAREVDVRLDVADGYVTLSVTDFGRGFSVEHPDDGGLGSGLRIMRYRAQAACGSLRITSSAGAGTRVEARLPVSRDAGLH